MRFELLKDFDDIYIINLHGSSKFAENIDGQKDENVFDIMVGVSINIFVKRKDGIKNEMASVHYKDIYGSRKEKLNYLSNNRLVDIDFEEIIPEAPYFEFKKKGKEFDSIKDQYNKGFKIDNLLVKKVQGFKTEKDPVVITDSKLGVENLINQLISNKSDDEIRKELGINDTRDWKLSKARILLKNRGSHNQYISKVCYRPFDNRWTYLDKTIVTYPRPLILESLKDKENWTLCVGKQGTAIGKAEWSLIYVSPLPTDMNVNPRGGAYLFPMYVYNEIGMRCVNFNQEILSAIENKIGLHLQDDSDTERKEGGFLAIDLMDYIYAVLHSKKYRETYHECLQNNFPTIPYPNSPEYFQVMANQGRLLREIHHLHGIEQKDFLTKFNITEGSNVVTTRKFEETSVGKGKVWINDKRYFDDVPSEAWNLYISGYQPLDKWLKDRLGKELNGDDIRHYQKMIVALCKTKEIQNKIDEFIVL